MHCFYIDLLYLLNHLFRYLFYFKYLFIICFPWTFPDSLSIESTWFENSWYREYIYLRTIWTFIQGYNGLYLLHFMKRNSFSLIRALAYVLIESIRMRVPCVMAYPQHHLVAQCQWCGVMTSSSSPMKTRTGNVAWELFYYTPNTVLL